VEPQLGRVATDACGDALSEWFDATAFTPAIAVARSESLRRTCGRATKPGRFLAAGSDRHVGTDEALEVSRSLDRSDAFLQVAPQPSGHLLGG